MLYMQNGPVVHLCEHVNEAVPQAATCTGCLRGTVRARVVSSLLLLFEW